MYHLSAFLDFSQLYIHGSIPDNFWELSKLSKFFNKLPMVDFVIDATYIHFDSSYLSRVKLS